MPSWDKDADLADLDAAHSLLPAASVWRVYPSAPVVYAIHIERWHSSRVPAYCREGWPVDFDGIRRGQLPGRLWAEPCSSQARRVPRRVRGWCRKAQDLLSLGNFNRRVAGGPERIDTNFPPEPFLGLHPRRARTRPLTDVVRTTVVPHPRIVRSPPVGAAGRRSGTRVPIPRSLRASAPGKRRACLLATLSTPPPRPPTLPTCGGRAPVARLPGARSPARGSSAGGSARPAPRTAR